MECKYNENYYTMANTDELIDTLWNVNYVFSDATLFGAGN